jgi:hypothetical protein
MKKSIILSALSIAAIMTSCKKEEKNEFTQTDVTGTTVIKGNVSKPIIVPDANNNGFNQGGRVSVSGVNVSIKINKNQLYPNSNAQGADIYSGTTDANGNYSIPVKTNANGVTANITIDGFTSTLDTVINGVTKTGLLTVYNALNNSFFVSMGQSYTYNHLYSTQNVVGNPNTNFKIGTAKITGTVGIDYVKEVMTGTLVTLTTTYVPVAGRKVYATITKDPTSLVAKTYEVTTDANGRYTFDIATVASGTSGFTGGNTPNATIWVADFATTRDTLKANNTIKTGKAGVYSMITNTENGLYNLHIRNAVNFDYASFTQD